MPYIKKYKYLRFAVKFKNHFITKIIANYFQNLYIATKKANSQMKIQFFQFLPFLVASFFTGLIAYLYYLLFKFAEEIALLVYNINHIYIFILTPISFLLSWYLVKRFAPYAKGSGIPQVMVAIEFSSGKKITFVKHLVNLRIMIVKIVASIVKVIGGGVVGREGPTVQIASSIFAVIYKMLPSWWPKVSQKNILIAGAASGLAAAFNTPLGGVIFAMEELAKFHMKHYQFPLFLAVIIAGLTAQGFGGSYLYLGYPRVTTEGWMILHFVLLTALISGYLGSKSGVLMIYIIDLIAKIKSNTGEILLVLVSALFIATTIYIFGTAVMGSGKEIMETLLFSGHKEIAWYIPFIRISNLIVSFGFGGAGGVFAPALSSGATIGAMVAQHMDVIGYKANLLILVGMTSFLTGLTRAPFTSAIIVFEMTDRHSVIFFIMFAAIFANIIANWVDSEAFYERLKKRYAKDVVQNYGVKAEHKQEMQSSMKN